MTGLGGNTSTRFWAGLAFAAAVAALVTGAFLSLGGYTYAAKGATKGATQIASAAKSAVETKQQATIKRDSAAANQYGPPKGTKGPGKGTSPGAAGPEPVSAGTALPFTGLSLLSTVLISLALATAGITLRRWGNGARPR